MEKIILQNRKRLNIVGLFSKPEVRPHGTCVIEHGWSGSKQQPHILAIQEAFLENGYQTFNFDATNSYNESDGTFEDSRLGLHYEDMEDVCKWVQKQEWFIGPLAISGHSMGGYATARYAEEFPEDVGLIAPIAPVISGELTNETKELREPGILQAWKETGVLVRESATTPGLLKLAPYDVHIEWQNHNLLPSAHKITMPTFLLTGSKDTSCPPDHVRKLFESISSQNKTFRIIEGAPHTYRTENDLRQLKSLLSNWLSSQE